MLQLTMPRTLLLFLFPLSTALAATQSGYDLGLDLVERSKKGELKTVEDFVAALPNGVFEMGNYGLAFKSKSRHRTDSKIHPRLVGKTPDGDLMVAYATGREGNQNPDFVELVISNESAKIPQFYAIDYSKTPPQIIGPNDKTCMACHTSRLKYNWDNYQHVHGFYGGNSDDTGNGVVTQEEKDGFRDFAASLSGNKRVSRLKLPAGKEPLTELWSALVDKMEVEIRKRSTWHLGEELKNNKKLDSLRFALIAALLDCRDLADFLPDGRKDVFLRRAKEFLPTKQKLVEAAQKIDAPGVNPGESAQTQANVDAVLALAGESMIDWETACKGNSADFMVSTGGYFSELAQELGTLENLGVLKGARNSQSSCPLLKEKSLAAQRVVDKTPVPNPPPASPATHVKPKP